MALWAERQKEVGSPETAGGKEVTPDSPETTPQITPEVRRELLAHLLGAHIRASACASGQEPIAVCNPHTCSRLGAVGAVVGVGGDVGAYRH